LRKSSSIGQPTGGRALGAERLQRAEKVFGPLLAELEQPREALRAGVGLEADTPARFGFEIGHQRRLGRPRQYRGQAE